MSPSAELNGFIIALSGIAGLYLTYRLGLLGQKKDEKQQIAATKVQERVAAFDELESLNDRLVTENEHLRGLIVEAEARGDLRLAQQARRCRERITELTSAMTMMQTVVLSEVARESAKDGVERAERHLAEDHPDLD